MTSRSSSRRFSLVLSLLSLAGAVLLLGGCQAIFTYSPLSGLQQSPSNMTPAQQLTYAQDALASGDQAAMKSAYDAIKNNSGSAAQYTTAQLGIELSGVPTIMRQVASNTSNINSDLNTISTFIANNNLSPTYMVAAAAQLSAAQAAGATLTDTDYAMGSMGVVLGASQSKNWDITQAPAGTGAAGQAYLQTAYNDPSLSGDLKTFIVDLYNYYGTLP